ncbi:LysR family transcriptional regulator [Luteolibacter arcticus]|uniref:LysR family transcriptional regulator n=1 Tax=Luteolibacter arcticus TaxID=1581411 RepID=A0ABT3GFL0_9BACT|nr:LysR family transcriptional regulator [Luteolibacter arcticus]MCW1922403.1 LysR family transcriptional regulator [Luteolibacter arcticus]
MPTKNSENPGPVEALPEITYRQLEVFSVTCKERSYANAALELHSTRANIKRVCQEFEAAVGRPLFEEMADRTLVPTPFAQGLLVQVGPLSRSLRKLGEGVRTLHQAGRILRFAAGGEFFRGGLFTDFLATLKIADIFRSCFVRIEVKRFRTALLNAECDVYFGIGLGCADRLDSVDLGPVPWKIVRHPKAKGEPPATPGELEKDGWWIADAGEPEVAASVLEDFRKAGAPGGAVLAEAETARLLADPSSLPTAGCLFVPETTAGLADRDPGPWPSYRLTACLRRNHPYAELKPRLMAAVNGHGH